MIEQINAVVFDTNAYRTAAYGKDRNGIEELAEALNEAESEKSIRSYAQPYVMAELLTHLADPDDSGFENCRRAVTLLWHHCKGENVELVRTLAEPELQMAKGFYEVEPDSYLETYGGFMEICKEVVVSDEDSELGHIGERLEGVERGVERAERKFIRDILMYVVKGTDPNAQSWQIFANDSEKRDMLLDFLDTPEALDVIAKSNIVKAMKVAGEEDSSQEVKNKAEFLSERFPVSLELYRQLIKKLVINEVDMTKSKHKNNMWDM